MSKNEEIQCPIEPEGTKVIILPDKVADTTDGGIYVPQSTQRMEQNAVTYGTLLALGPMAEITFNDKSGLARPGKAGDRVVYCKYGGTLIKWGETEYRIMQDADIVGLMKEDPPVTDSLKTEPSRILVPKPRDIKVPMGQVPKLS